jgi:hypothetical protein
MALVGLGIERGRRRVEIAYDLSVPAVMNGEIADFGIARRQQVPRAVLQTETSGHRP